MGLSPHLADASGCILLRLSVARALAHFQAKAAPMTVGPPQMCRHHVRVTRSPSPTRMVAAPQHMPPTMAQPIHYGGRCPKRKMLQASLCLFEAFRTSHAPAIARNAF